MKLYKRKMTVDYRDYDIKYSDGSTSEYYDRKTYEEKVNSGLTFSALTGGDKYILVFFEQKTKDLGFYNDIVE